MSSPHVGKPALPSDAPSKLDFADPRVSIAADEATAAVMIGQTILYCSHLCLRRGDNMHLFCCQLSICNNIMSAACSADIALVSIRISQSSGGSYGLSMPVKFFNSPRLAFA